MGFAYEGIFYIINMLGNKVEALEKILDYREQEVEGLQEENEALKTRLSGNEEGSGFEYRDVEIDDLLRENEELRAKLLTAEEEIGCMETLFLSRLDG